MVLRLCSIPAALSSINGYHTYNGRFALSKLFHFSLLNVSHLKDSSHLTL